MRLTSVLWMVVTPLVLTVGAVIVLTPRDILRQPVLEVDIAPARAPLAAQSPAKTVVVAEVLQPPFADPATIQPATLTVVASVGNFGIAQQASPVAGVPRAAPADRRWITAGALNMRTGPGKDNELVASLPFGTPVNVLELSGTWARVEADGVSGWLSAKFLTGTDPGLSQD